MGEMQDQEIRDTVRAGLVTIRTARAAAEADIVAAEALRVQAQGVATNLGTLASAVAGFTPSATYSAAQLGQVKAALAQVIDTQTTIANALAEMYGYRKANDQVAVIAHKSLEFVARYLFGDVS